MLCNNFFIDKSGQLLLHCGLICLQNTGIHNAAFKQFAILFKAALMAGHLVKETLRSPHNKLVLIKLFRCRQLVYLQIRLILASWTSWEFHRMCYFVSNWFIEWAQYLV